MKLRWSTFVTGTIIQKLGLCAIAIGLLGSVWILVSRVNLSSHAVPPSPPVSAPAPAPQPEPGIVLARREIPGIVSHMYEALDGGTPSTLRPVLSERARDNFRMFDTICKPYTYRAHYIENIVERPDNRFEAWVRVLVKPLDERAYTLVFINQGGSLLLDAVADPPQNWFADEEGRAIEIARQFVYAAKARRGDVISQLVPAEMPVAGFLTDPCWQQFFFDVGELRVKEAGLESYKGLKVKVRMYLDQAAGNGYNAVGDSYFFVERVGGDYKIVAADPRGNTIGFYMPLDGCRDLTNFAEVEDPNLEARTLARFHLQGGD